MLGYYEMTVLGFMGINILLGLSVYAILATDQLSIGNAGFMAVGAYVSAFLTVMQGWPLVPAILMGAIAAVVAGLIIGIPALRLSGIYVVLATLGFGEMIRNFFNVFEPLGAEAGFRGPMGTTVLMIYVSVVIAIVFLWLLKRSRLGHAFDAVRDDPLVASTMGLPVTLIKVGAFAIGAFIAGVAGALYAHYVFYIEAPNFNFVRSTIIVLFVILGGMETLWGAVLGACIFTLLPEFTRFMKDWRHALYGGILIGLMILRPGGLLTRGMLRRFSRWISRILKSKNSKLEAQGES